MVALVAALLLGSPTVVATINTGSKPCGSAVYGKYLYVDNYGGGTMSRSDPATNKVVSSVSVGSGPSDGVRGPDGLEWIPNFADGTISRIDPATDTVVDTITVGGSPFVVRSAFGDVWVGDFAGSTITRIHP